MDRDPEQVTASDEPHTVEQDAQAEIEKTRRLYRKGRHDEAVAKRVAELIAADPDIPPPADQEALLANMAEQMLQEAKKTHLQNVARARAIKAFDEWKKTAPRFDCDHIWQDTGSKNGPRQRCQRCGEAGLTRKLKAT